MPAKKRLAIFAHYDRDGVIDEHALYYLRGLRPIADRILFVSDSDLRPGEAGKIAGLAEFAGAERHREYDFGSWKRGFAALGDGVDEWDEIVLANDSCFAPVYPFEDVFARMDEVACDAWSGTASLDGAGQLQALNSYFLVLRRPVLADARIRAFWPRVKAEASHADVVIRYEEGFTKLLSDCGFALASYVPASRRVLPYHRIWLDRLMAEHRAPWIKVRLFTQNIFYVRHLHRYLPALDRHYPRRLIDAHVERVTGSADPLHYHFWIGGFTWPEPNGEILRWDLKHKYKYFWKVSVRLFNLRILVLLFPALRAIGRALRG